MGFEKLYGYQELHLPECNWGVLDGDFLAATSLQLQKQPRPFFAYVITLSSHSPFDWVAKAGLPQRFADLPPMQRNYLNAMAYVDSVLNIFIRKQQAIDTSTVFILYGDHTPGELGEGPMQSTTSTIGNRAQEYVPLLIFPKPSKPCQPTPDPSFLDIGNKILTLAQVPFHRFSEGKPLCQ